MFLNLLNNDDKIAFYHLAKKLIAADGKIDNIELVTLQNMKNEMQIDDTIDSLTIDNVDECLSKVADYKSKVAFFLELLSIALSDDILAKEEKQLIDKIANTFGFNDEKVSEFINWSNQMLELTQEARLFFVENFKPNYIQTQTPHE